MRKRCPWLAAGLTLAFSLAVFNRLPERIPVYWDSGPGAADGWSSRVSGSLYVPAIMLIMALILPQLPRIDPRRQNYEKFRPTYDLVVNAIITMLGVLHVASLGVALGWPISMERITPVMLGALFILLGNVMPRARPNWLFGIRTPWTLTNDRVWERTHRLGGYLFVAAGIVVILLAAAPPGIVMPALATTVGIAVFILFVYSYFAWKQETSL